MQIVSPRQVPVNGLLERISTEERLPMTVLVGSDASHDMTWPKIEGDVVPPVELTGV